MITTPTRRPTALQAAHAIVMVVALTACRGEQRHDAGEQRATEAVEAAKAMLVVPHATGAIRADGELDEPDWLSPGRTGPFSDVHGQEARPYSDARLLWDETNLFVALYAADDDIRGAVQTHDGAVWADDSFAISVAADRPGAPAFRIDVSALGFTADERRDADGSRDRRWESGTSVGMDRDGTPNDPSDEDEEWVAELAIPWASLGIAPAGGVRIALELGRCDAPKGASRRCGSWGKSASAGIVLGPAVIQHGARNGMGP